ncbi:YbhB/YbcL family Raf kinase inhibitor-like protein [Ferruginibacter sp.]|uniref:YbhB/YbcL family Raf kinase inhibitor-like protein n=1 Tax=Ferruginibacter sp. TaxID=1940288 RepID=UPI002659A0D5|nr:YbhB/YbcL family Raf kinase inhibitor-like protein [Ferruginibacter sp.]
MTNSKPMKITSNAFMDGGNIPSKYTCDGEDVNPPLMIENVPQGTQTLAIIVEDPDAITGVYDHWLVWNMPPERIVEENRIPGISGRNGAGKTGYHGPCPPSGTHRYYFFVFALDVSLDIESGSDKRKLQEAMKSHILAQGTLMALYTKEKDVSQKNSVLIR